MKGWLGSVAIGVAALAFMMADADARITHIEITKAEPAFGAIPLAMLDPMSIS